MFRIKICGVTSVDDAQQIAAAGADAIGLNFYPASPRYVAPERAQQIAQALPSAVSRVGLFVNADPVTIVNIAQQVPLDLIQLHGDESPEEVAQLRPFSVLKAFRAKPDFAVEVLRFVHACQALQAPLAGVLIDAYQPGAYGGTGATADWEAIRALAAELTGVPIILAGGLKPDNVADAITAVRPDGVDTASGVESAPGHKDPALVAAFVRAAQQSRHQGALS